LNRREKEKKKKLEALSSLGRGKGEKKNYKEGKK
jgi:hypothetical protein